MVSLPKDIIYSPVMSAFLSVTRTTLTKIILFLVVVRKAMDTAIQLPVRNLVLPGFCVFHFVDFLVFSHLISTYHEPFCSYNDGFYRNWVCSLSSDV